MGHGRKPREVQSNVTDNQSAKMKTSKGVLQGYTGVAAADKKHQIVVVAEAFGHGQEQNTLQPVLRSLTQHYRHCGIHQDILSTGMVITADTGYANEANNHYLYEHNINAYIPDNAFRSRDPRHKDKLAHHGRKYKAKHPATFASDQFNFDPIKHTCHCPAGQSLRFANIGTDYRGKRRAYFKVRYAARRHFSCIWTCTSYVHTLSYMNVTWDPVKARINLSKHGIDFADAVVALEDENALTKLDSEFSEFRFKTLAMSPTTDILMIVHAEQDEETIRIISARPAEKAEERTYFEGGYHG